MKNRQILFSIFGSVFLLLLIAAGLSYAQEPLGPGFTYQGQLALNGQPVNAACDFQFGLYDAAAGGNQLGLTQTESITVTKSLFTTRLNNNSQFGPDAFNGQARWLEIGVRCPGDSSFTGLGRQPLTAAPYTHYAGSSGALNGQPLTTTLPLAGQVLAWNGTVWGPATDAATTYTAGFGLSLTGQTFAVATDTVQARVTGACGAGYVIQQVNADGTVSCAPLNTTTGDITSVSAGAGLSGGGASGAVTLTVAFSGTGAAETVARADHSHPGADITSPVATATLAYSATAAPWGGLSDIPADIADGDADTTYTAGPGLPLSSTQFSLTPTYRLPQSCADGQLPAWNGSGWSCLTPADGDITSVSAGAGLSGGGAGGAITLTVAFSGTGAAETVARSDHSHSDVYPLLNHTHVGTDITSPVATATLAYSATAAPWSGLSDIPADIADGDADTTYTAGAGLVLSGTQFSLTGLVTEAITATWATTATEAGNADTVDGYHAGDFVLTGTTWLLTGNAGTTATTHFIGTTDAQPLVLRTANTEHARLDPAGNLGLGAITPTERLTVRGNVHVLGEDTPKALGYTTDNLHVPYDVYVSGRYAYVVSNYGNRLTVMDISDPANIVALGNTSANLNRPTSVAVAGRYAYVTSYYGNSLAIFDISDPANIVAKGTTNANLNYPNSVAVAGRYAYVVSEYNDRLAVFDVSAPANIVALGFISTGLSGQKFITIAGRYAYVTANYSDRLSVFDVSDPANVVAKGATSANLSGPYSVAVAGHYAYVASFMNNRLAVFDVSNPANLVALGYTSANMDGPISIAVAGRYAYVASNRSHNLSVFDVTDPASIVALGTTNANLSYPLAVSVSGRYAYVVTPWNNRLVAFELNHLAAPTLETGSLQSGRLDIIDNASIGNNLHVQGGLNVGAAGALINGDVSVQGKLFARAGVTTLTGSTSLVVTQAGIVLVNNAAGATITLPTAASATGLIFTVKRLTANAVTVASAGGTIDGAATQPLAAQYDFLTVVSDGANWHIIGR
jgi:hypothetical protein